MEPGYMYPTTVKEMLAKWDNYESIWSVEMGGMGPGYEQAIQVGIVETCRALEDKELIKITEDGQVYADIWDEEIHRIDNEFELGLSGAQASAIKSCGYQYLKKGPRVALLEMKMIDPERLIQVAKHFPGNVH